MDDFDTRYAREKKQERVKARKAALARPWPMKLYAYVGWIMDNYDCTWIDPVTIIGMAIIHLALLLICLLAISYVTSIGLGWLLLLIGGALAALGGRKIVLAYIEYDRTYRE